MKLKRLMVWVAILAMASAFLARQCRVGKAEFIMYEGDTSLYWVTFWTRFQICYMTNDVYRQVQLNMLKAEGRKLKGIKRDPRLP